jgi:hypothetical protein
MNKITALHQFLLALDLFAAEQLDSFVDDMSVQPGGFTVAEGQILLAQTDYTAAFFIERFPHAAVSINVLIAQISAWLIEHDYSRADYIVNMNVEVLDAETADLEFRIGFREEITATEDVNGAIEIGGVRYSL